MSDIIYLASYPKSGNTWFRTFISNLLCEPEEEVSINNLKTDGIYSSRPLFDSTTGIEASNLTHDEIDRLRPLIYNSLKLYENMYIKVHDAYTYLEDGSPLMGNVHAKAIYIIRNPLDVAVSFANHSSVDLDTMINRMNSGYAFCDNDKTITKQLRQKLLTWSGHVKSWADAKELQVYFLRYEDMKLKPVEAFTNAVRFIGLNNTDEEINEAIIKSGFEHLKKEENELGFKEKPFGLKSFFRKGEVGDWRNHLSSEQVESLIGAHKEVMTSFGYLDEAGAPIY